MSWINNNNSIPTLHFSDGSFARFILIYGIGFYKISNTLGYGCAFFCRFEGSCMFSVILVETMATEVFSGTPPQVIWSANHNKPVDENASLEFWDGNLILRDSSGIEVWSSGTKSTHIVGMTIVYGPYLVLFNGTNGTVWQSFDYPTDTLLPGQLFHHSQSLTSSLTSSNSRNSSSGLFFSLYIRHGLLIASILKGSLIPYFVLNDFSARRNKLLRDVMFENEMLILRYEDNYRLFKVNLAETQWLQASDFIRLDPDGGLRIYKWAQKEGWMVVYDFMARQNLCMLSLQCGKYGVCKKGQCSCPKALDGMDYFSPLDTQNPQSGCSQVELLSSQDEIEYQLVDFGNLSYFPYADPWAAVSGIHDLHDCKEACMRNISCQAVFFLSNKNDSGGLCYLPSQVLSIREEVKSERNRSFAYLKVKVPVHRRHPSAPSSRAPIVLCGIFIAVIFLISAFILVFLLRRRLAARFKENLIEQVLGMPTKFSYKDLCLATQELSVKIGRGGFGTVFRGVLTDGKLVAVKRLDHAGQGMDEFLAEMKIIGSIQHINLVQLIGFCAEKTERLLVYEYMSNGSLDAWIFGTKQQYLDWQTKKKIITDIAKALSYVHEECKGLHI